MMARPSANARPVGFEPAHTWRLLPEGQEHQISSSGKPIGSAVFSPSHTYKDSDADTYTPTSQSNAATPFHKPLPVSGGGRFSDARYNRRLNPKHEATNTIQSLSPDSSSRISSRDGRHDASRGLSWWIETLCFFVAIGAIIAIIVTLRTFDGRPLSDWGLQITLGSNNPVKISLNFLVSLLGILAKSAIVIVLSAGLSQLKWNWFSTEHRSMRDFELFDSASRGASGSLRLIWRTRARRIASLGALLTILSLMFDPFLQLLIDYPGTIVVSPDSTATLSMAYKYSGGTERTLQSSKIAGPDGTQFSKRETQPDSEMVRAIQNALWNMNNRIEPEHVCKAGNCTWPDQVSLAVCSTCHDISQNLQTRQVSDYSCGADGDGSTFEEESATIFHLDSPLNITLADCDSKLLQAVATTTPNNTISFRDSQTLLMSLTTIWASDKKRITKSTMRATECGLMLCANTYRPQVQLGDYTETILESRSERVSSSWQPTDHNLTSLNYVVNGDWSPLGPSTRYPVERTDLRLELTKNQAKLTNYGSLDLPQHSVDSLLDLAGSIFDTIAAGGNTPRGAVVSLSDIITYDSPAVQALFSAPSQEVIFHNLAYDMSSVIRTQGTRSSGSGDKAGKTVQARFTGSTQQYAIIISIRWPFMAGPVAILLLAAVFLLATVIQTHRQSIPVWKEGALAALVWGLDTNTREMARELWVQSSGFNKKQCVDIIFRGNKLSGELRGQSTLS